MPPPQVLRLKFRSGATNETDLKSNFKVGYLNRKLIFTLFTVLLIISVLSSCTKEQTSKFNEIPNAKESNSSCEPGEYSVSNGVIIFDSFDDFFQTRDFLSCASDSVVDHWVTNLSFSVSQKWLEEFSDSISQLGNDSIAWINYWNASVNQGKIGVTEENNQLFSTNKYPLFPYFIGASGYFKIGNSVYSEKDNHIISVPDGSLTKLSTALSTMQTDTTAGIFVYPVNQMLEDEFSGTGASTRSGCCPHSYTVREHAVNNNGIQSHRLRVFRSLILESFFGNWNGQQPFNQLSAGIRIGFEHHRRGFLGRWYSQRRDATYSLTTKIDVTCGSQSFTTNLNEQNVTIYNSADYSKDHILCSINTLGIIPPPVSICIVRPDFFMPVQTVNFSPAIQVTLPCEL